MNRYVSFQVVAGNLVITVDDDGDSLEALSEIADKVAGGELTPDTGFLELIDYQLCNGWRVIDPGEIGALTSGLILTDSLQRDENGKLLSVDVVYWDRTYETKSLIDTLVKEKRAVLFGVSVSFRAN